MNKNKILALLTGTVCLAVLSYFFFDKKIAWFVFNHKLPERYPAFRYVSYLTIYARWLSFLGFIYFLITYFKNSINDHYSPNKIKRNYSIAWAATSLAITTFIIEYCLKSILHRYWPSTWVDNNLSLTTNHAYGFMIFLGENVKYASFPSGHAATICAIVSVYWVLYPKGKLFYAFLVLLTAYSLLIMNYHFLSDILIGGMIGFFTGYTTVKISLNPTNFAKN